MLLRSLLVYPAVVLSAVATTLISTVVSPLPAQALPCGVSLVIGVDGTASVGDPRSIVKTKVLPVGGVMVDYPASLWPVGPIGYDASVRIGIDETKRIIRKFKAEQPCGRVHLIGHSQGARVAGDAIAELFAEGMNTSFLSAELLSDPRTPGTGIEVILVGWVAPGITTTGERPSMGSADVVWRCTPGDPICVFPRDLIGILSIPVAFARHHGSY
ncbi:cutinase family protein [Rhodococcus opacus]|uniref:Uncharacterized protein n=1 Tax=Rhodococcus opacus TaxID=37919 RepID=A0A2S8JAR9_RHOOP|nr:PE-PPE domain-containing protein [Rhodococcus opacus]PQP24146.1 hypothetical protein C5613_14800 [Rhodococcus opacus]